MIELAALARSTALFTGAVLAIVLAWLTKHNILFCCGMLLAGAVVGWLIGMMAGQCLFPAAAGKAVVVKVGGSSLPAAFKAALSSAVLVSLVIALGFCILFPGQKTTIIAVSLGIGVMMGTGSSLLSALL